MRFATLLVWTPFVFSACTKSAPLSPSSPQASSGPWIQVAAHNVHQSVMAAGFLTEDYGITAGVAPGIMFYTSDGGRSWHAGTNESDCRYGLEVVDRQVAFTCGGMTQVRRSIDGGRTWLPLADFGNGWAGPCYTISFINPQVGWLATKAELGATDDGGMTWQMLDPPQEADGIASIDLTSSRDGYLLDFSGTLYRTHDLAQDWEKVIQLDLAGLVIPRREAYQMAAVRFSEDGREGLIVVSESYQKGRVMAFHTSDHGFTWTSELVPAISGPVFLSRLEPLLTILNGANIMTVLRYGGD